MSSLSQSTLATLRRVSPDSFTLCLLGTMALATVLPCTGTAAKVFGHLTSYAIGLLFFLHGAKLSRESVVKGVTHWRLHLLVLAATFVMFPLLGLLLKPLALFLLTPELYLGILFLCVLPSTIQSSVAFTAVARGNVPAAICSASASNFLGIFLTPLLVGMLILHGAGRQSALDAVVRILLQLLLPFLAGQWLRRWIGGWIDRNRPTLRYVDQGSILLVVYTAFSDAVSQGLWHTLAPATFGGVVLVCCLLLALAMGIVTFASRRLGFNKADQIAILFCASKKSMASGVPMAKILFPSATLGMVILPVLLFHQIQMMVCAVLAQRLASRAEPDANVFSAETSPPTPP